jgi:hypothetical protein
MSICDCNMMSSSGMDVLDNLLYSCMARLSAFCALVLANVRAMFVFHLHLRLLKDEGLCDCVVVEYAEYKRRH